MAEDLGERVLDLESASADPFLERVRSALMAEPGMLFDAVEEFERQQVAEQAARFTEELEGDTFLPVLGNPDGDITIVEYFDYNCGYCRRAMEDVLQMVAEDGNIRLILKEFPVLSEGSQQAALVALAAAEDVDYLALHRLAMTSPGSVDGEAMLRHVATLGADRFAVQARLATRQGDYRAALLRTQEVATALGITGTPAFYIEGELIPGAVGRAQLEATIAEIRAARDAEPQG